MVEVSKEAEKAATDKKASSTSKTTTPAKSVQKEAQAEYSVDLRDLLEAGCHFGHQARRWNPKMEKYIFAERDGVHIFDLAITAEKLVEAMQFVNDWVAAGNEIVFVGTKRQASAIIKEEAMAVGAPYMSVRWLGGTLTNWSEMKKRIKRLNSLKEQKESGELKKKYTKKETVLFDREIARLERFFGGIAKMSEKPQALFIVDTEREITAIKEANLMGVPIVGLVDTNGDPDMVDYVIPVNDDAVRSIKLMVSKIAKAYLDGKNKRTKVKPKTQETRKPADKNAGIRGLSKKPNETSTSKEADRQAKQPAASEAVKKTSKPNVTAPKKTQSKKSDAK